MIDFVNVQCSGQHVWDCAIVWGVSPCLVVISDALQPYTFNQLNFAEVRNFVSFGEVKFFSTRCRDGVVVWLFAHSCITCFAVCAHSQPISNFIARVGAIGRQLR